MAIDHKKDPSFNPSFEEKSHQAKPRAPFPVSVLGLSGIVDNSESLFGVGHVIGSIELSDGSECPVIELQDKEDGKNYTLSGLDCLYTYPPAKEVLDAMFEGTAIIGSVKRYIEALDRNDEIMAEADRLWLEANKIDPDSI